MLQVAHVLIHVPISTCSLICTCAYMQSNMVQCTENIFEQGNTVFTHIIVQVLLSKGVLNIQIQVHVLIYEN